MEENGEDEAHKIRKYLIMKVSQLKINCNLFAMRKEKKFLQLLYIVHPTYRKFSLDLNCKIVNAVLPSSIGC